VVAGDEVVVIGVGNPDRGDDAIGPLVASRLAGRVRTLALSGETTALLDALARVTCAIVVDASRSGAPPGTISRFDVGHAPLPAQALGLSSHGLGVVEALELARTLGSLPARCIVYSIEGEDFTPGAVPTARVTVAVDEVVERIASEIVRGEASCTKPR
jgi:hydrogenase maturation protease